MSREAGHNPQATSEPSRSAPSARAPGQPPPEVSELGDFVIRREIGRGGMGTVYEAWQRSLDRIVALKVLDAQVGRSRAAITRFQREAQAAAKLQHTHIIPIFAQGEQNGVYYYAMEFVEGDALNAIIAQQRRAFRGAGPGRPDLEDTVELPRASSDVDLSAETVAMTSPPRRDSVADSGVVVPEPPVAGTVGGRRSFTEIARHIAAVAGALGYAHDHGVIHRDIKPHNLMMGPDGRLRIADFGLARIDTQPGVTVTGEFLGSPLYMSAEQITKGPASVDHRTDLYSLGATFYEWLTLGPPFSGETREHVISRILSADAVPPRKIDPAIPVQLETICLKAIEKDPSKRYQSGREMEADLRRFLDGQSILATRAGGVTRTMRAIQRRPLHWIGAAAAILLLIPTILLLRTTKELNEKTTAVAKAEQESEAARQDAEDVLELWRSFTIEGKITGATMETLVPMLQSMVDPNGGNGDATTPAHQPVEVGSPESIARRAAAELYASSPASDTLAAELAAKAFGGGVDSVGGAEVDFLREIEEEPDLNERYRKSSFWAQRNPDNMHARRLHAASCANLRHYDEMLEQAEAMVQYRGDDVGALLWRGLAHLLAQNQMGALADFGRAIQASPDAAWAYTLRALALIELDRADEALVDLERVFSAEDPPIVARLVRGAGYAAREQWDAAIADVSELIEHNAADADALALRGEYRNAVGEFSGAAEDFKAAMDVVGQSPTIAFKALTARVMAMEQDRKASAPPQAEEADARSDAPGPAAPKGEEGAKRDATWRWLDRVFDRADDDRRPPPRRQAVTFPPRTF